MGNNNFQQFHFPTLFIKSEIQNIQLDQQDFADFFAHHCHAGCITLLNHNPNFTNQFAKLILCRGFHDDCISQHSWIVAFIKEQETYDIYDGYANNPNMVIIDPTIWSYQHQTQHELEIYAELLENEGIDLGLDYLTTDSFNQYRHLLNPRIQIIQHNHEDIAKYHPHGNKDLDYDDYKNTYEPLFKIHCVLGDGIVCPIGNLNYLLDSNYLYLKAQLQQSNDVVDLDQIIDYFINDEMTLTKESIPVVRYNITNYLSKHFPAFLKLDYKTMFLM